MESHVAGERDGARQEIWEDVDGSERRKNKAWRQHHNASIVVQVDDVRYLVKLIKEATGFAELFHDPGSEAVVTWVPQVASVGLI
jgi:hypothetical protein